MGALATCSRPSLVVTSLSFVWIFSRHPLYPALHDQYALLHMTPLFDQQLAGSSKNWLLRAAVAIAFTIFSRAEEDGTPVEDTPLHWRRRATDAAYRPSERASSPPS